MAQKGRVDLTADNDDTFYPNLNKEINASDHNEYNDDMIASKYNLIDDTLESINLTDTTLGDNAEDALNNINNKVLAGNNIFYLDVVIENLGSSTDILSFSSNNPTVTIVEQPGSVGNFIVNYTENYGYTSINISSGDLLNASSSNISGIETIRFEFINTEVIYIADL